MSLIIDALKTAQQRSTAGAPPVEHPLFQGLVPRARGGASSSTRERVLMAVSIVVILGAAGFTYLRLRAHIPKSASAVTSLPPVSRLPKPAPQPQAKTVAPQTAVRDTTPAPVSKASLATPVVRLAGSPARTRPTPEKSAAPKPVPVDSTPRAAAPATVIAATPAQPTSAASALHDSGAPVQIQVEAGTQRPVDALMSQALAAQRQGDLPRAKQIYDRAINIGPVSAALYNNYGALLNAMGNSRDAIAILRLALSIDRAFTNAWINLSVAEDAAGDHGAAVGALEQALKLDPTNRDSKVNLAEQYLALGVDRDARRIAEDVVAGDPTFAAGHYVLARALEAGKDLTAAAREFARFLELGGAANRPGFDAQVRAHINAIRTP